MALLDVYSFTASFSSPFERGDVVVIGHCDCHGDNYAAVRSVQYHTVHVIAGKWKWLTRAIAFYLKYTKGRQ